MVMPTLSRLAATPWIRSPAEVGAVGMLARTPHRVLGTLTTPSITPALTPRLPMPSTLSTLLNALRGRLAVTNPCATARLPRHAVGVARAALRRALDATDADTVATPFAFGDTRDADEARRLRALLAALPASAADALAPGSATWAGAVLYEPTRLDVSFPALRRRLVAPEPHPVVAVACYRLAIVVGRDAPPEDATVLDAAARAAPATMWPPGEVPRAWFVVRVLVSDAVVAATMDATTLARWAALTGRAGAGSRDTYWFAESWERFRDPAAQRVGHVTPAEVARSRRARTPAAPTTDGSAAYALAPSLTPSVERGVPVPPGYCLVDCVGTLEIAVVAPTAR